jgi:colicin import membrane protein
MASKLKQTQLRRKEQYERRLNTRMALLAERKNDPSKIDKDPLVKNLRANIEATLLRLKAIAKIEQRTAELAKMKAEKAEAAKAAKAPAPEKAKEGGKEKAKGKKKEAKEAKEAPAEGKEKKKKKEKSEADAT